ncbi:MAG: ChaN family lipoprotein [Deltaproteobacteria bacterium]|nr:ChaN family lipoprotein [Deltaproteobacteria bacterium]
MPITPREELLALQKKLYRQNKRLIEESILINEPDFVRYETAYNRVLKKYKSASTISEMLAAVKTADIIYVGDYHTCNQSQRSFLRILKEITPRIKNYIIGLELLHKRHQAILEQFLKGKLSEESFLKKVGLKKHWVFDLWENFKPLFDFAKYHDIPLFAIDAAPKGASLKERDRATAKLVAHLAKTHPDKKIFVFIGDLHIAPSHLPLEVNRELKKWKISKKELILYQNSEPIYWHLAKRGLEDKTEAVKINENSFCRMHTPPVVCQRSYLNWLEHEEGEIDYADAKHSFVDLVERISHFLKIDVGEEKENVEVFTCGDLSFLNRIQSSRRFSKEEIKIIKQQIIASQSYYIPKLRFVYLSNISLNHAAEEAAHFIKHICSGEEKPRDPFDAFYANVLHEALGFFGSKIINHKRKCFHEKDFQKLIRYFQSISTQAERHLEFETALLVAQCKKMEKNGEALSSMDVFHNKPDLFFMVTHALGYMLGDRLYYALLEGVVTKSEIRHLFYDPWKGFGKPFQVYWTVLTKIRDVIIPKRM